MTPPKPWLTELAMRASHEFFIGSPVNGEAAQCLRALTSFHHVLKRAHCYQGIFGIAGRQRVLVQHENLFTTARLSDAVAYRLLEHPKMGRLLPKYNLPIDIIKKDAELPKLVEWLDVMFRFMVDECYIKPSKRLPFIHYEPIPIRSV